MNTITAAEYRDMLAKPKRNKYNAQKVEIDGHKFDSKAEARYYVYLKDRAKKGEIYGLELQRPFALIGPDGTLITTYRADFYFYEQAEKRFRVIDVKGGKATQTDAFRMKKRLMKSLLGIDVEVVEA